MRPWPLLIAAAAGLALGLVAGELTGPREPQAAERTSTTTVDLAPLVRTLEESSASLTAELRLLRDAIEHAPAPSVETRRLPVAEDGTEVDLSPLVQAMDRLDRNLRFLASERPVAENPNPIVPAGLRLPAPDYRAVPFPTYEEMLAMNFGKRHFLWSCQEVLDAYGLPNSAWVNEAGELVWAYEEPEEDGDGLYLELVFVDALVVRSEY